MQEQKSFWKKPVEWLQQNVVQPVQQAVPKVMNWVDQHQREIALGIGIAAGVAAVVLSGGAATPLVAAAWVAGSAVVAVGITAAGTVGLNAYFHRPLGTNMLQNLGYAAGAAALTATAGFALAGGVVQQGLYSVGNTATRLCVTHPTACARVSAAFTLWDKVEDLGLQAKLALQTWQRDPRAAETALELQLERLDNAPGNTTFRELQEALSTLVGRYGDDVARLVKRFGNEGAELLARHQDEAVEVLDMARQAVRNPDAQAVLIGRYFKDTPNSYERLGEHFGFTHLNMDAAAYKKFQEYVNEGDLSADAWWRLVNEPFIQEVARSRKPVYVNVDPNNIRGGNLSKELEALREYGYQYASKEIIDGVALWKLLPSK